MKDFDAPIGREESPNRSLARFVINEYLAPYNTREGRLDRDAFLNNDEAADEIVDGLRDLIVWRHRKERLIGLVEDALAKEDGGVKACRHIDAAGVRTAMDWCPKEGDPRYPEYQKGRDQQEMEEVLE